MPPNLTEVIAAGQLGLDWVGEAVHAVLLGGIERAAGDLQTMFQPSEVTMLAPVPRPVAVCCSTTWEHHIREAEARGSSVRWPPEGSLLKGFYKANATTVAAHQSVVPIPPFADGDLDIECELAAIVGTGGINLSRGGSCCMDPPVAPGTDPA